MRKINPFIIITFIFVLSFSVLFGVKTGVAYADNIMISNLETKSKSVYLYDPVSKTELYKSNENEKLPIASMCKIMTLLLIFDEVSAGNINLDDNIIVSENASSMGGSQVFLEENGEYLIADLVKSITIASANDACVAMAEKISGTEEEFVCKMNEKAKDLGMENTIFSNCTGLPKPGQYSTAKDVATMFSKLIEHEEYFNFSNIWLDKINHPKGRYTEISNTNKLIRYYDGCDSGKTGYTKEAGHCLCASATRKGMRLISVVINSPDSKTRFAESSALFNYGFNNFLCKILVSKDKPLPIPLKIENGKSNFIQCIPSDNYSILLKNNEKRAFDVEFYPDLDIKAPIKAGDVVGKISVFENSIEIGSVNVVSLEDVARANYFDYTKKIFDNWALI